MAGLVAGVGKPPIRRPPVALQHPRVVLAKNLGGVLVPAAERDQVDRHLLAGERPQPGLLSAYPPAGLIRRDRATGPDTLDQRPVGRLQRPGLPRNRLHDPASADLDPEPFKRLGGLLRREPQLLVELGRQRDRARAEHARSRAQRVGALKRVTALMAATTTSALADV